MGYNDPSIGLLECKKDASWVVRDVDGESLFPYISSRTHRFRVGYLTKPKGTRHERYNPRQSTLYRSFSFS